MNPEVLTALIGLAGAVAGSIITAFSGEIKFALQGRLRRDSDLLGDWSCKWYVAPSDFEISDRVVVEKVAGEKIIARAQNTEYGNYELVGRLSKSSLLTMHYEGKGKRQPLGGVIILTLNPTRDRLNGYWYEYGPEGDIIGGKTEWVKTA